MRRARLSATAELLVHNVPFRFGYICCRFNGEKFGSVTVFLLDIFSFQESLEISSVKRMNSTPLQFTVYTVQYEK